MSSVGQLVPQVTRSPPNMTVKFNGPHVEGSFCTSIDYNYDPVISVICAMYIAFGIVYTLFGYRCFKATMFLTGFTFGSAIVYLICLQEYLMPPYGNVGVALCAGLLFGLITMLIQYVGLFMTGFHTGVLLAIAGLAIYDHFLEARPTTYWLCVVVLLCSGIFFAVINLYWKKVLTIIGTSVYGGAVMATSLDYFFERMMMLKWVIIIIIIILVKIQSLLNIRLQASQHRSVRFFSHVAVHSTPCGSPTNAAPSGRQSPLLQNLSAPSAIRSPTSAAPPVVGACETGADRGTTLPTVMADAGCVASCSHSGPDRAVRSNRHRHLPRTEYKRTKASLESPTDSTDHPRATNRDEAAQIPVPVPGPHGSRGRNFTVVRTSAAEKSPMRELERGVQHSSERLDPPNGSSWLRGRPTYRQRR